MKILLLDDHPIILSTLEERILEMAPSAEIFATTSLEGALEIREKEELDYAVCDLQIIAGKNLEMPALCFKDRIPYMVYSSHVNKDLVRQLEALGVRCYVNKSSPGKEVTAALRSLFRGRRYFCTSVRLTKGVEDERKPMPKLIYTKAQGKIIDLLDKGYDQKEVAVMLKVKLRTVLNHLAMAREVNDCDSSAELLRRYRFWEGIG